MKINDVINCINATLETEREAKNLPKMLGHFVYYIVWEKGIGPIKTFHSRVDFVNVKYDTTHCVVADNLTINCPNDKVEEVKETIALRVLKMLFQVLRLGVGKGAYENYVNGEFQGWS